VGYNGALNVEVRPEAEGGPASAPRGQARRDAACIRASRGL